MPDAKPTLTPEDLDRQEVECVFSAFDEDAAYAIGTALHRAARARAAPVVIDIRLAGRTLFHAALPGSTPDNAEWARRKSNVVLRRWRSSLAVGLALAEAGQIVGPDLGMDPIDYVAHGGSFPIRVRGVGVVGAITISGLASEDDHAMIVAAIRAYLDESRGRP